MISFEKESIFVPEVDIVKDISMVYFFFEEQVVKIYTINKYLDKDENVKRIESENTSYFLYSGDNYTMFCQKFHELGSTRDAAKQAVLYVENFISGQV